MKATKRKDKGELAAHTEIADGDRIVGRVFAEDKDIHKAQVDAILAHDH